MLETLKSREGSQSAKNPSAEPISRKDGAAYLAALIDGEGSIQAAIEDRSKKGLGPMLRLAVQIHNNNYLLLNKAAQICLDNNIPFCWTLDKRLGQNGKACGSLHIAGKERVKRLLMFVLEELSFKRQQAKLMLDLIDYREKLLLSSKTNWVGQLAQDIYILKLIADIKREKHEYSSLIEFSRRPNTLLTKSSETLCSSSGS